MDPALLEILVNLFITSTVTLVTWVTLSIMAERKNVQKLQNGPVLQQQPAPQPTAEQLDAEAMQTARLLYAKDLTKARALGMYKAIIVYLFSKEN